MKCWIPTLEQSEFLREKYAYTPETGEFWFKETGQLVGLIECRGYKIVKVSCKRLNLRQGIRAHRLAWFLHNGVFPTSKIDHVDHDVSNNRIDNLREVSDHENMMNMLKPSRGKRKQCSSKYKGVHFHALRGYWIAGIRHKKQFTYLGHFDSERDAAVAYNTAAIAIFGEFACLNEV